MGAVKKIKLTSAYVSDRVFDGVRKVSPKRAAQLRAIAAKNKARTKGRNLNQTASH